jgi:peptidoglycan-associated lipoprotein
MKTNLIMMALVSLVISACASPPTAMTAPPPAVTQETTSGNAATETGSMSAADVSSTGLSANDLAAQLQEMQKNSVYFDFNEFVIKPEYRDLMLQRAEFMKSHGDVTVTLEGNADERGSSEYNLALGDKRANTVRKSLNMLGVPDSQIKTVSLGEEHPRLACHEEQCWKENRRVDFMGKPGS